MEKAIRKYGNVYRKALLFRHYREIEAKAAAYEARLRAMYASYGFKAHSVYPTTNAVHNEAGSHVLPCRHHQLRAASLHRFHPHQDPVSGR